MHYISPAEAARIGGLRLVLTIGVPGPWGEAAKGIFHVGEVSYTPVAQIPFEANEDLVAWTGLRNAPIAVYEDEMPRASWLDILMLAERLGSGRSLLPEAPDLRATVVGLGHEICGEWGLGWCRRLIILHELWGKDLDPENKDDPRNALCRSYGYTAATAAAAPERVAAILHMLSDRLDRQKADGSPYLVGDQLSAADIYWAAFSGMVDPMPADVNPMPAYLRDLYRNNGAVISEAIRPNLIEHRDFIYRRHLRLPLEF